MSKFGDRVRFNWGYHDGAWDTKNGRPRCDTLQGPQSLTQVSREYDAAYYNGYIAGKDHMRDGLYAGNSENAWRAHRNIPAFNKEG